MFPAIGPDPARALDVVTPGGLERYYEELSLAARAADTMDRVAAMEERFGVKMDWTAFPSCFDATGFAWLLRRRRTQLANQ